MGKGMRENQIMAVIKRPGRPAEVEPLLTNTGEAIQAVLGGEIVQCYLGEGLVILNSVAGLHEAEPFNCRIHDGYFYGTIMVVSLGDDGYASIPGRFLPRVLKLLKEDE